MTAYYNENDRFAAEWLRNLIAAGKLPAGDVDDRSILEVRPADLAGYSQCHFFAGIGGWPLALVLAGWEGPAWTGSCPCQPFSSAGSRGGADDKRHLWPAFHALIAECRPDRVFGEQVAGKDGRTWLAAVRSDLEALGYAVGAADLAAAGAGAPHIRQRLWFVGIADRAGSQPRNSAAAALGHGHPAVTASGARQLADANSAVAELAARIWPGPDQATGGRALGQFERCGDAGGGVGDARGDELGRLGGSAPGTQAQGGSERVQIGAGGLLPGSAGSVGNPWSDADWLPCRDGKARPVEPGTFPLAHGIPARVGCLRGYGNAIVPPLAAEFVKAVMEVLDD